MIRSRCLLVLAALVIVGLAPFTTVAPASSLEATPIALLPHVDEVEILDSVPVSLVIRNNGNAGDRLLGGRSVVAALNPAARGLSSTSAMSRPGLNLASAIAAISALA